MHKPFIAIFIGAFLTFSRVAPAQVTTATVYGTVTDPTGASVPAATVILTHQQTGAAATKVSTESGDFQFDFLRVGSTGNHNGEQDQQHPAGRPAALAHRMIMQ